MKKKFPYDYQPRLEDGSRPHYRFRTKKEKDEFARKFENQRREKKIGLRPQVITPNFGDFARHWLAEKHKLTQMAEPELTYSAWCVFETHLRLYLLPAIETEALKERLNSLRKSLAEAEGWYPRVLLKRSVKAAERKLKKWNEESELRRIVPAIDHIPIDQFNSPMIKEYLLRLRQSGVSPQVSNRVRTTLHSLFSSVSEGGFLQYNPVSAVKRAEENTKERAILESDEEIQAWLRAAKELGDLAYALESTYLNTGGRRHAVPVLKWKDWDETQSLLHFQRMFETASGKIVNRVKGKRSYTIGVNDAQKKIFQWWKEISPFKGPEDFIFADSNGNHLRSSDLERIHNELRKATGLNIVIHGKRHTAGTHITDKAGLRVAQDQLGHSDQRTTERYAHKLKDRMATRANAVNFEIRDAEVEK